MKKVLTSICLALALTACGPLTYTVPSSAKAPGADAKIVARVNKDSGSTQLEVMAENLPPPGRIADGAEVYVAWHRKDSSAKWQRISGLKYDESSRKGTLEASTPETSFDFEISAEKDAKGESPSSDIVFAQHIN